MVAALLTDPAGYLRCEDETERLALEAVAAARRRTALADMERLAELFARALGAR